MIAIKKIEGLDKKSANRKNVLKKRSLTLIETLIACALMAAFAFFLLNETFSFREKYTFQQDCREITALLHEAATLSLSVQGEVDVILEMGKEDEKEVFLAHLLIWEVPLSPVKNQLEKKRPFHAIRYVQRGREKSDTDKIVIRFFPRGVDTEKGSSISCVPYKASLKDQTYTVSLLTVTEPISTSVQRNSIPDEIESLAL